jgi:hypothetical protein
LLALEVFGDGGGEVVVDEAALLGAFEPVVEVAGGFFQS